MTHSFASLRLAAALVIATALPLGAAECGGSFSGFVEAMQKEAVARGHDGASVARGDEALLGVASWRNGSALALIGDAHGVRLTPANSLGQLDVTPTASSHDGCRTALAGRSLGARPPEESAIVAFQSGPVLLAGTRCDAPGRLAVERLSPRGPSTLTDLPAAKPATNPSFELAAASEKDVHLLERESGQLWHFDGTRWSHSEGGPYLAIAVSRQNTFWVVTARNLAFRRPGEDLVSVPLELAPWEELREISAPSDDDVWLLSQRGEQRVLRASGPSRGPLERLPGDDAHWSRGIPRQPLSPVCQQPYVLLLSRVNPKETAFAGVQQRHDVGVRELGGELDLAAEALAVDPGGELGRQHLDHDLAAEGVLAGHEDATHPPTGELALDGVGGAKGRRQRFPQWIRHAAHRPGGLRTWCPQNIRTTPRQG